MIYTIVDCICMEADNPSIYYTKSMIFFNGTEIPTDRSNLCCFWDRHSFETAPWFCPIKYEPTTSTYEVDGVFCSRQCVNAWLYEHNMNLLYKDSPQLLSLMNYQRTGSFQPNMTDRAPSWKLLQAYGGDMSIEQFRESFSKVVIMPTDSIERPFQCYPVSYEFSIHQKWGLDR